MLEVIRFWLTKDLKYAKGKPCKPYNSCLGEFFRVSGGQKAAARIACRIDRPQWEGRCGSEVAMQLCSCTCRKPETMSLRKDDSSTADT